MQWLAHLEKGNGNHFFVADCVESPELYNKEQLGAGTAETQVTQGSVEVNVLPTQHIADQIGGSELIVTADKKTVAERKIKPSDNRALMNNNIQDCYNLLTGKQSHAHRDVNMNFRTDDDPVRKEYNEYRKNYECLSSLVSAIESAEKEQNSKVTPGITAAVDVVNLYAAFLKKEGSVNVVIQKCGESLNLLAADIKNCPLDLGGGQRIKLALFGVGYAITAFALSVFNFLSHIVVPIGFRPVQKEIWAVCGRMFQRAFENFKETWTGERKPSEMIKLEEEIVKLSHLLNPPVSAADNPYGLYSQKKPEHDQMHVKSKDPSMKKATK